MNSAAQTLAFIKPGIPVILNCGLGPATWNPMGRSELVNLRAYNEALREVLEPGYRGGCVTGEFEATLVTTGVFNSTAGLSTLLYEAVEAAQDCIAIYYPSMKEGYLLGPYADRWGAFNINLFKLPEDASC